MAATASSSGDFAGLEAGLEQQRLLVEAALRQLFDPGRSPAVAAAMEDSLFAPAKRLRPILALMVSDLFKVDRRRVLPAACAIEWVHTASLILDDLPSMDNARLRRGRPTCHVGHGEATAILAAFGLQNQAFALLAAGWPGGPGEPVRLALAADLAQAIGLDGMIAGQHKDLEMTNRPVDFATLEFIHSRKTGALFVASAMLGARVGHAPARDRAAVATYAKNVGLAFQVVDDLIDATGVTAEAGKDVGQDRRKITFVSFSGVLGARALAEELVKAAEEALSRYGTRAARLRELARYVVARRR